MKIGTDLSLSECRNEGYTVIEFGVKNLFPNGRKEKMDQDYAVSVTISNPYSWEDGKPFVGATKEELYFTDKVLSFSGLKEVYDESEGLKEWFQHNNFEINWENPNEYDLLNLADWINSYQGMD